MKIYRKDNVDWSFEIETNQLYKDTCQFRIYYNLSVIYGMNIKDILASSAPQEMKDDVQKYYKLMVFI